MLEKHGYINFKLTGNLLDLKTCLIQTWLTTRPCMNASTIVYFFSGKLCGYNVTFLSQQINSIVIVTTSHFMNTIILLIYNNENDFIKDKINEILIVNAWLLFMDRHHAIKIKPLHFLLTILCPILIIICVFCQWLHNFFIHLYHTEWIPWE